MKKLLIAMLVLCLGVSMMAAAAKVGKAKAGKAKVAPPAAEWVPVSLGFWYGLPASMTKSNVRGWRIGWPVSAGTGTVKGFESAFFCAATDNIEGVQMSFGVCITENLAGWQVAPVNICDKIEGVQLGVVNVAGKRGWQIGILNTGNNAKFQLGLLNVNKGGLLPWMILANFGKDTLKSAEAIRAEKCICTKLPCKKCKGKKKCVCKKAACKVHPK